MTGVNTKRNPLFEEGRNAKDTIKKAGKEMKASEALDRNRVPAGGRENVGIEKTGKKAFSGETPKKRHGLVRVWGGASPPRKWQRRRRGRKGGVIIPWGDSHFMMRESESAQ